MRAVAILLVLMTHLWTYPGGHELLNRIARVGWAGVDLFFVLSGYLITSILRENRNAPRYYRNFYARRTLRIFPLYYLLLFIVFVVLPLRGSNPALTAARSDWPLFVSYLSNVAIAAAGWQLFLLDITWSLSVEEQFYLVWPRVVRYLTTRKMLTLCAVLIVASPVIRFIAQGELHVGWMWVHMLPVFRADSFAVGAFIAVSRREGTGRFATRRVALWVASVTGIALAYLVLTGQFDRGSLVTETIGHSLLALVSGALIIIGLEGGAVASRILRAGWLRHVGKVSYGMYIYHPLCMAIGATAIARAAGMAGLHLTGLLGAMVNLIGVSLLTVAVATASFAFFERPILGFKRYFGGV